MKSLYRLSKNVWQLLSPAVQDHLRQSKITGPYIRRASDALIGGASHDEIYDARYYDYVDGMATRAAPAMVDELSGLYAPVSIIDVGCGTGAFLAECRSRGIEVYGLEYSEEGIRRATAKGVEVGQFDLNSDALIRLPRAKFDLVTSFEVAEHLPSNLADNYVRTLVSFGHRVVITAAIPGQGGLNHVNEQPNAYWIEKMQRHGMRLNEQSTNRLRHAWRARLEERWYAENVLVFERAT